MKRSFSLDPSGLVLVVAATGLIAATYGLVRLAYGLFLPDVQSELGLGVAAAGAVSAGASVVYAGGALAGFLLAGRRPFVLVGAAALTAAGGAAGMAIAPDAAVFGVSAVVASAGAGFASPALVAVLLRRPATGTARVQTIVNAGTGPGLIAAGVLALVLLPDWRTAWAIAAVFTLVVAAIVVLAGRGGTPAAVAAALPPGRWFSAHRSVLAAAVLLGVASAAVWNYGRSMLVDDGVAPSVSVLAWIALGAGGAAVIGTAGWMGRLRPATAWMLTATATAVATASLALAPALVPVACVVFGWGYTAGTGALIAWTARIDEARAPAGTAMLFVTLILGQAVGAAVVGALIPLVGYTLAFSAAAGVAVLAAAFGLSRRSGARNEGRAGDRPGR